MKPREPKQQDRSSKSASSDTQNWWKRFTYLGGALLVAIAILFATGYVMDAIRHAISSFKQLKLAIKA